MQNENQEDGISLGQLFKVMFGRKILLAIITVVIFIIGTLVFKFGYNDSQKYYQAQFDYTIQGINDGQYLDGSSFDYRDLISLENLKAIQESNQEEYGSVDVEAMYENNDIYIKHQVEYLVINDTETEVVTDEYYVIYAKESYFKSSTQAKNFISDVASQPLAKTLELVNDMIYTNNLTMFDQATIYESQVNYLQSQLSFLTDKYNTLMNYYGNTTLSNGVTISTLLSEINIYFENYSLSVLNDEIKLNGYVKEDTMYQSQLKTELDALNKELELNGKKLTALEAQRNALIKAATEGNSGLQNLDLTSYNEQIVTLTLRNQDITYEIEVINKKLETINNRSNSSSFETKLKDYREKLEEFTKTYQDTEKVVVANYAKVNFAANSKVVANGGYNMLLIAIVFLVLGGIVGCVVNLCLDGKKLSANYVEPTKENQEENKDENN